MLDLAKRQIWFTSKASLKSVIQTHCYLTAAVKHHKRALCPPSLAANYHTWSKLSYLETLSAYVGMYTA